MPTRLGPDTSSSRGTSILRFSRSSSPSHGVSSRIVNWSSRSMVMSGIPCQARTRASVIRTVRGSAEASIGSSVQALTRHCPVGSAICPDQRWRSCPSLVKVRFSHEVIFTTISTSFEPSRSLLIVETMPSLSESVSANDASWKGSIFVVRPKFNSGVSRNVLTCAPSILRSVPTSNSNGSQERKPMAPDSSASRPRTTSMLPLPSRR